MAEGDLGSSKIYGTWEEKGIRTPETEVSGIREVEQVGQGRWFPVSEGAERCKEAGVRNQECQLPPRTAPDGRTRVPGTERVSG